MGRSAPSLTICPVCGKRMTVAGFAVASHKRKHVREGLMTEVTPEHTIWMGARSRPIHFNLTDAGRAQSEKVSNILRRIREVTARQNRTDTSEAWLTDQTIIDSLENDLKAFQR